MPAIVAPAPGTSSWRASPLHERVKPTLLFFVTALSATGGGQHALARLACELTKRKYRVVVFTRPPFNPEHRYVRSLRETGIPVHVWRYAIAGAVEKFAQRSAGWSLALPYAIARGTSPGIGRQAGESLWHSAMAARERSRIFKGLDAELAPQGTAILHVWGPAALTPTLLNWASSRHVPAIYHEMGEADEAYVRTWRLQETIVALEGASAVICSSPRVEACVRSVYGYAGSVYPIPFLIADPGDGWQNTSCRGTGATIGVIGRLVPHKRHTDLMDAVARLRERGVDATLLIAGDGPHRAALERYRDEKDLQGCVTFTGEFDSLAEVMAQFDIFAITSSSESQCMPIVEAMSYGKPAVVADSGGMPDFVDHGQTGLVVPMGDIPALADAIGRLATDPEMRATMGRHARQTYLDRYTPERIVSAIEQVYERVGSRATPSRC
jgi:glycosyltransferase involved in cell wall biosynthesis